MFQPSCDDIDHFFRIFRALELGSKACETDRAKIKTGSGAAPEQIRFLRNPRVIHSRRLIGELTKSGNCKVDLPLAEILPLAA